jgi:hypothetical protein
LGQANLVVDGNLGVGQLLLGQADEKNRPMAIPPQPFQEGLEAGPGRGRLAPDPR